VLRGHEVALKLGLSIDAETSGRRRRRVVQAALIKVPVMRAMFTWSTNMYIPRFPRVREVVWIVLFAMWQVDHMLAYI
jgi:hypothetical protein